jgi:cobalt/nickel transport system permease protein
MIRYRPYLERNLFRLSQAIQESMFADETAAGPGWLQSVDARIKLAGFLLLILSCSFSHDMAPIAFLLLFSIVLVAGSSLFSFSFFRRLWFFIPLYTALIAIPALFLTPGDSIARLPGIGWIVTEQGLRTALLLVLRVTTTVSFLLLLILTTRWAMLLKALRFLGIPHLVVFMLAMTHRYIYVLLHSTSTLFLARQSRRVGPEAWRGAKEWMGTIAGALLGKSYSLSSEIYLAMVSRGFKGEPVLLSDFKTQPRDWLWLSLFSVLSGVTFFWKYLGNIT